MTETPPNKPARPHAYWIVPVLLIASVALIPTEPSWAAAGMRAAHKVLDKADDLLSLGEIYASMWGMIIVGLLVLFLDPDRRDRLRQYIVGLMLTPAINTPLKILFMRQRPPFDRRKDYIVDKPDDIAFDWFGPAHDRLKHIGESDWVSYPSGHSAAAAFIASFLTANYPRGRFVWWGIAIATMLQRFEGAHHFASDTFAGAAIGMIAFRIIAHGSWFQRGIESACASLRGTGAK